MGIKEYRCDIGSWERGRVVTVYARYPWEAVKKARDHVKDSEELVQVYDGNRCVYDYMNGFLKG